MCMLALGAGLSEAGRWIQVANEVARGWVDSSASVFSRMFQVKSLYADTAGRQIIGELRKERKCKKNSQRIGKWVKQLSRDYALM